VVARITFGLALIVAAGLAGCDSPDRGTSTTSQHPDTGYGANQTVPTESCANYCLRTIDCVTELCEEDTGSTAPQAVEQTLLSECTSLCVDSTLQSGVSSTAWSCLYTDTCRQVLGEDACQLGASYTCSAS